MITPEQAKNALAYLETLAGEGLWQIMCGNSAEYSRDTYDYNYDMRQGAVKTLKEFVRENTWEIPDEQKQNLINNWIGTLRVSFGGLDFWQLSKTWKNKVYGDVARMIVDEMVWFIKNNNSAEFK